MWAWAARWASPPPGAVPLLDFTRFRELHSLTPSALGAAAPPRNAGIYFWFVMLKGGRSARAVLRRGESGSNMLGRFSGFVSSTRYNKLLWPMYALSKGRKLVYGFVNIKAMWLAGGEQRKRGTPPADAFKQLSKQSPGSWRVT